MIIKAQKTLYSSIIKLFHDFRVYSINTSKPKGLLYTLYSDKDNLLEVGFTRNKSTLNEKIIKNNLILLDMKHGNITELNLLKRTLKQLGLRTLNENHYKYTSLIMKHLNILGWPIGNSLYKQRKITKEISYVTY